ncbi:MAG: urea transport system ATP-binding protein [Candidatus Omnitrophota bacterium]|jgi:urea transport system ATP-binding protein
MLNINELQFAYGEVNVLRGVTLDVPTGSMVCMMGRNGVGKTTLMQNILGLYAPKSGSITLDGEDVTKMPPHKRVKNGMAYVPQGRHIFSRLTVEENLRTGLSARGDKSKIIPEEVFEYFPVLKEMRSRQGGNLSGGQQQQLAIGRALVTDPRLLILDEPTEGIQPNIITLIGETLRRLVDEKGLTVLIVEQYLDFVRTFSHRFLVMNRGVVVAGDETTNLHEDLVKEYLHV